MPIFASLTMLSLLFHTTSLGGDIKILDRCSSGLLALYNFYFVSDELIFTVYS
jgi:hypothetical protein